MEFKKNFKYIDYSPRGVFINLLLMKKEIEGARNEELFEIIAKWFTENYDENLVTNLTNKQKEVINKLWHLSLEEALAYSFVVFDNLLIRWNGKDLYTDDEIMKMFSRMMDIFSPRNVIDLALDRCRSRNLKIEWER